MNQRFAWMSGRCAVWVMVAALGLPTVVVGQTAGEAPRTDDGRPDLQGVWDFRTITPLERPEQYADREFLSQEEAAQLEQEAVSRNDELNEPSEVRSEPLPVGGNVGAYNNFWMDRGTRVVDDARTSLIVDPPNGRIPPLTAEGQARKDATAALRTRPAFGPEDRSMGERCILGFNAGPPMEPRAYNNTMQLFQTADHVVVYTEMVNDSRVIPLDERAHLPEDVRQWRGDSRGRWEGDTLVVETTNFHTHTAFSERQGSTPDMHLVERFTRIDEDTLLYGFTVDDPATWVRPWTAVVSMVKSDAQPFEYACHEGNYGMDGILTGARADEQANTGDGR
jgi:hypothetical protein